MSSERQVLIPEIGDFEDIDVIEVLVAPENKPSQRVVEKVGFVREGVARGAEFLSGSYLDHIQYALLRSDVMSDDA